MTTAEGAPGPGFETTVAELAGLGFRPELLRPADDPSLVVLSRAGVRVTVSRPGGETDTDTEPMGLPELVPEVAIAGLQDDSAWGTGRAGMRYRDLIPGRLGGRFIASHIEVCDGGPIPDQVHHHAVRFQIIVCQQGWVDVVYQDQGPPFRMEPGDLVLQPPGIRHQVLASSAGARVVEVGSPAVHDTQFDYELELPTPEVVAGRSYGGQRFVRHTAADSEWVPSTEPGYHGFETQVTDIATATDGLAQVVFNRASGDNATIDTVGTGSELNLVFVLAGRAHITVDGQVHPATQGFALTLPAQMPWQLDSASSDLCLLRVRL